MKSSTALATLLLLLLTNIAIGQNNSEDEEPILDQTKATDLIEESSFEGWEVPSEEHWSIENGTMIGGTKGVKLTAPQWLYTEGSWSDFIFTIEAKITGDGPNSGVYFRARKIDWKGRYEAATGYEYDFAEGTLNGSIGDYFSRPRFRIRADQAVVADTYNMDDWNRLTIRARGNRIEYWMNGMKIQDYRDEDPSGSREGIIGLQLHDKIVMKAEFRNAYVLELEGDLDAPPSIVPGR